MPLSASAHGAPAARTAVAAIFLVHGLLTGGWAPHIPLAKEALGVGPGLFGWLLLSMAAGGVVAMPLSGALVGRFGSAAVCRVTGPLFCLAFALPVSAATPLTLALGLFAFGAALGALDVAMNVHGLAVETRLRRPVMSAFHAWFSVGAALGAGLGGVAVSALGAEGHAALTVAGSLALIWLAQRRLLPSAEDAGRSGAHFVWPTRATLGLGALCFLALFIEGAMLDWSALHLAQATGADVAQAGLGFAAFAAGMAVARFAGDGLRARFGAARLVFVSAAALTAALAVAVGSPLIGPSVAAFAIAGLGVGNIAPVLFAGGGRAEPDAPGRGVAAVTTLGYCGFLLGPPVIGMAAEVTGLQTALLLTVAAALVIAVAARAARAADGAATSI